MSLEPDDADTKPVPKPERFRATRETWLGLCLGISIGLYVLSLTQNAFCVDGNCSGWPGYGILLFGALGLFTLNPANFAWIANPILFVAWGCLWGGRGKAAVQFGIAAFLIAFLFLLMPSVVIGEDGMPRPRTGLRLGYFLWLASMGAAVVAAAFTFDPDGEAAPATKSPDKASD